MKKSYQHTGQGVVLSNRFFILPCETVCAKKLRQNVQQIAEILLSEMSYHTTIFIEKYKKMSRLARIAFVLKTARSIFWPVKSEYKSSIHQINAKFWTNGQIKILEIEHFYLSQWFIDDPNLNEFYDH